MKNVDQAHKMDQKIIDQELKVDDKLADALFKQ